MSGEDLSYLVGRHTTWIGSEEIMLRDTEVVILAVDNDDPSAPGRRACWVRNWPSQRDFPVYRSCDLCDLNVDWAPLTPPPPRSTE